MPRSDVQRSRPRNDENARKYARSASVAPSKAAASELIVSLSKVAGRSEPVPGQVPEDRRVSLEGDCVVQGHQLIARLQQPDTVLLPRTHAAPRVRLVRQVHDVCRARLGAQRRLHKEFIAPDLRGMLGTHGGAVILLARSGMRHRAVLQFHDAERPLVLAGHQRVQSSLQAIAAGGERDFHRGRATRADTFGRAAYPTQVTQHARADHVHVIVREGQQGQSLRAQLCLDECGRVDVHAGGQAVEQRIGNGAREDLPAHDTRAVPSPPAPAWHWDARARA